MVMQSRTLSHSPHTTASQYWLDVVFSAKAVQHGGVVRRSIAWVENEIGREQFEIEVKRRGFHLIEAGRQFIVACSPGAIKLLF